MIIEINNRKINSEKIKILSDLKDWHSINTILVWQKRKLNLQN